MEIAIFGAGCFWGVEEAFSKLDGVQDTSVGYLGGSLQNPSYEDVCSGETGHAEVVRIEFDPAKTEYKKLLDVFWKMHDPTTLNRQGPDVGTQYRSAIFYQNLDQKNIAEQSKTELQKSGSFGKPIVTEITAASTFYKAEEYHQAYLKKNGLGACHI